MTQTIDVNASAERVFAVLTSKQLWNTGRHLQDRESEVQTDFRPGGSIVLKPLNGEWGDGLLIATVLHRITPSLLTLRGYFGTDFLRKIPESEISTITITLTQHEDVTRVVVDADGKQDSAKFLEDLKKLAESDVHMIEIQAVDHDYESAQTVLIQIRQAVAQAIATEKQLEQQASKNRDQASTWQERAELAVRQNNNDLAKQALQRKQQYEIAAKDLEKELTAQRDSLDQMRVRLTNAESAVQSAYTRKQVLIARYSGAKALAILKEDHWAEEIARCDAALARMENEVADFEAKVGYKREMEMTDEDSQNLLWKTTTALERAIDIIKELEARLRKDS